MVSILGKRARATDSFGTDIDSRSTSQRVKRRATLPTAADNKVPPAKRTSNLTETILEATDDKENLPQLPTPKTPRHRDALSTKIQITPRHSRPLGKPLTPHASRTPRTLLHSRSTFASARKLFVTGAGPSRIIGRDDEKQELSDLIDRGLQPGQSQCVYVSGPPGTGKSAVLGELCNELQVKKSVTSIYVNCMSLHNSEELCKKLVDDLSGDPFNVSSSLELAKDLYSMLSCSRKSKLRQKVVIILDEVDSLLRSDVEIVYKLFEWSLQKSSNFVLVGIANALDLTDRFLPRLKARNLKPQLLPFMPYTAGQIQTIISGKLRSLVSDDVYCPEDFIPFIHPAAIQLCAKKVASQAGDLRKAFNIIRRTIELLETETAATHQIELSDASPSKSPLCENPNLASARSKLSKSPQIGVATLTALTAPRATISHVSRVAATVLSQGTTQRLQGLNLQQKAALAALVCYETRRRPAASALFGTPSKSQASKATVRALYNSYNASCQRTNSLTPLTLSEFVDVASSLESMGLVGRDCGRGVNARSTPSKRVKQEDVAISSLVDLKEIKECLQGAEGAMLHSLMDDV